MNDMNGDHLSPKTRELLDRPIEERIAHIQKDSWILIKRPVVATVVNVLASQ